MKNRKGIIRIEHEHINNISSHSEILFQLFSEFVPVRIENDFNCYEYHGYSPLFDELKEGEAIPIYDARFTYNETSDSFEMEFKKL